MLNKDSLQGTSRGCADIRKIAESLGSRGIDMVFVVGGNGGNAGANAIQQECCAIDVTCSVIALPKSIDNDLMLVSCHLQRRPFIFTAIQSS
jgi:6-phosphofructokinase 1